MTSLKLRNAGSVLTFAWTRDAFTASDAMAATGLTRTTVISLCLDLVERGWLEELPDTRADGDRYQKGRPARRYAFRADRAVIVGVDAGLHTVTTRVVDLRGRVLALTRTLLEDSWPPAEERVAAIDHSIAQGLASAGVDGDAVLCLVVGVPAPADAAGDSPDGANGNWRRMNPDLRRRLRGRARTVIVENDANLAAVGEGTAGAGAGADSYATLLIGERFGAGLVIDGRLLRGSHGGAGEMHPLSQIRGVGDAHGIGNLLRSWVREARDEDRIPATSPLNALPHDGLHAEAVFRAAEEGDPFAAAVVDRAAERLARIAAVLAGMLDVERVIFAGVVAQSLGPMLSSARERLAKLMDLPPPELIASTLGGDVVGIGAVGRGLAWAHENVHTLIADRGAVSDARPGERHPSDPAG